MDRRTALNTLVATPVSALFAPAASGGMLQAGNIVCLRSFGAVNGPRFLAVEQAPRLSDWSRNS